MGVRQGLDLSDGQHGVEYAQAQRCKKNNGKKCQPCKAVCAAYKREWYQTHEEGRKKSQLDRRARQKAMTRLAQENRKRYRELYKEERAKLEVDNGA